MKDIHGNEIETGDIVIFSYLRKGRDVTGYSKTGVQVGLVTTINPKTVTVKADMTQKEYTLDPVGVSIYVPYKCR